MLLAAEITLNKSENHPADATSTAGGVIADPRVLVTAATIGEVLPKLRGLPTGELDTDLVTQYQVAYVENTNAADTLADPVAYVGNFLAALTTTVALELTGSSSSDGSTKFVRLWGEISADVLGYEDITLAGLTMVTSVTNFIRVFRAELRLVSNGTLTTAAADIDLSEVGGDSIGMIPQGYSVATREFAIAVAAANGDVDDWADRHTEPAGLTWVYPRDEATAVALPDDLGPEEYVAIYWRQEVQPGMATSMPKLKLMIVGDA